ncbi:unnamed protein product [Sphenostylis stenocarpa]|uniref:Uncharacterized protein n=1 Tax=Sphenostylis stenocarpa TaxID=92480 RepID=A0AA86SNX7_9FABA|nr:unnamed protein product [Sphenostylis stenocarpa]
MVNTRMESRLDALERMFTEVVHDKDKLENGHVEHLQRLENMISGVMVVVEKMSSASTSGKNKNDHNVEGTNAVSTKVEKVLASYIEVFKN